MTETPETPESTATPDAAASPLPRAIELEVEVPGTP